MADFSLSTAEAYETNTVGESGGVVPTAFRASGFYSEIKAHADYAGNSERIKFLANAGSDVRYYPDLKEWLAVNRYVGGAVTADFFHRTTVSVHESLAYSSAYLYGLFPGTTTPVPGLVSPFGAGYTTNETSGTLSQRLTSRATAVFGASYRKSDFNGALTPSSVNYREFAGRFEYRFSRTGIFRTGYTYREGQYWSGFRATENGIEAGVELARALSRTRRAALQFNVGSTLVNAPAQPDVIIGAAVQQQHGVQANVAVSYDLGSTWHARGSYHRGVMFVDGFLTPFNNNGYGGEIGGFVNRRVDVLASGGYSTGVPTIVVDGSVFNTRTADVRLRYALGRNWATYVEYLYYYYRFDQVMLLSPILGPSLDQNGLHFGLTLWTGVRRK
jgi:hypothetical protein